MKSPHLLLTIVFSLALPSLILAMPVDEYKRLFGEDIDISTIKTEVIEDNTYGIDVASSSIKSLYFKVKKDLESGDQSASSQGLVNTGSSEIDSGLSFLRGIQSPNGNFSNSSNVSSMIDTYAMTSLFNFLGLYSDDNYQSALTWIDKQYYENTLSEALKLVALAKDDRDILYSLEPLLTRQNSNDGGFGYSYSHESDPITTSIILIALNSAGYSDYGDDPNYSENQALLFLANSQNIDGGWGETVSSDSDIKSTVQVLEALYLYRNKSITKEGVTTVINNLIKKALNYLKQGQSSNGRWNDSFLDTIFSYDILHKYKATLNYENPAFDYIKSQQNSNGSFHNGNVYITANALKALSWRMVDISPNLAITNIEQIGTLVNGTDAEFAITIKNIGRGSTLNGDVRVFIFAENFNWIPDGLTFLPDRTNIGPNQEIILTIIHDTEALLGTTTMKYYIETPSDSDYSNNWGTKTVNFAPSLTNKPALPMYFVAFKHEGASGARLRWSMKPDINRINYVVMYRKVGDTTWTQANVPNTINAVSLNNVLEEGISYQITIGVKYANDLIRFLNNHTTLKPSAISTNYTGDINGILTSNNTPLANSGVTGYLISKTTDTSTTTNFAFSGLQNGTNALWSSGLENDKIITKFKIDIASTTSGIRVFTRTVEDILPPSINYIRIKDNTDNVIENNSISIIEIGASDDINTKEVDLSYYNPNTNSWVFIETIPLSGSVSAFKAYNWSVSSQLSGNGFKLRGTVRDYGGNQTSAEYGPFAINDITDIPPSIQITQPDGLNDNAHENFTISWNDTDPDSSAIISLYYDTDANGLNGTLITSGISEDNAINDYVWNTSTIPNGNYYVYATIKDSINATSSDYSSGIVIVYHAPALIKPSTPTNLTSNAIDSSSIRLNWIAPINVGDRPIIGYKIERKLFTDTDFTTIVSNTRSISRQFIDSNLTPSTIYQYRLSAITLAGIGNVSSTTQVLTHNPTTNPSITTFTTTATRTSTTTITLNWTIPTNIGGNTIVAYQIFRKSSIESTYRTIITNTNNRTTQYNDSLLIPSIRYSYYVRAITGSGSGIDSNITTFR